MGRSPPLRVCRRRLVARFALAFASPPPQRGLGLPPATTRRLIMQKAGRHSLRSSDTLYAIGFRYYFTPLTGVLFTFPSRYWFTIGHRLVFSLGGWSPQIQTGFPVAGLTQVPISPYSTFRLRGSHPILLTFPCDSTKTLSTHMTGPTTPEIQDLWFGLFPLRSPLLWESLIDFFSSAY